MRAVCVLSIVSTSLDCVLTALGQRQGIFTASFTWAYWVLALSLAYCAVKVAMEGSR